MHSNGFAVTFEPARKTFFVRGHVHVEIAAQQSNVNTTLRGANPVRYASLSIPSGQQTSEIIAQVGVLLKSNLSNGPLAPLSVRRVLLEGTSQASGVLRTYQQQKHFQARMADGGANYSTANNPGAIGGLSKGMLDLHTVILWGAVGLGVSQIPFIINLFYSIKNGKKAANDNPWEATTLEWQTPTPPPHGNFAHAPQAYRGPYEYSVPGAGKDFVAQFEA